MQFNSQQDMIESAMWVLDYQINTVADIVKYLKVTKPAMVRFYPAIEQRKPWDEGLDLS